MAKLKSTCERQTAIEAAALNLYSEMIKRKAYQADATIEYVNGLKINISMEIILPKHH